MAHVTVPHVLAMLNAALTPICHAETHIVKAVLSHVELKFGAQLMLCRNLGTAVSEFARLMTAKEEDLSAWRDLVHVILALNDKQGSLTLAVLACLQEATNVMTNVRETGPATDDAITYMHRFVLRFLRFNPHLLLKLLTSTLDDMNIFYIVTILGRARRADGSSTSTAVVDRLSADFGESYDFAMCLDQLAQLQTAELKNIVEVLFSRRKPDGSKRPFTALEVGHFARCTRLVRGKQPVLPSDRVFDYIQTIAANRMRVIGTEIQMLLGNHSHTLRCMLATIFAVFDETDSSTDFMQTLMILCGLNHKFAEVLGGIASMEDDSFKSASKVTYDTTFKLALEKRRTLAKPMVDDFPLPPNTQSGEAFAVAVRTELFPLTMIRFKSDAAAVNGRHHTMVCAASSSSSSSSSTPVPKRAPAPSARSVHILPTPPSSSTSKLPTAPVPARMNVDTQDDVLFPMEALDTQSPFVNTPGPPRKKTASPLLPSGSHVARPIVSAPSLPPLATSEPDQMEGVEIPTLPLLEMPDFLMEDVHPHQPVANSDRAQKGKAFVPLWEAPATGLSVVHNSSGGPELLAAPRVGGDDEGEEGRGDGPSSRATPGVYTPTTSSALQFATMDLRDADEGVPIKLTNTRVSVHGDVTLDDMSPLHSLCAQGQEKAVSNIASLIRMSNPEAFVSTLVTSNFAFFANYIHSQSPVTPKKFPPNVFAAIFSLFTSESYLPSNYTSLTPAFLLFFTGRGAECLPSAVTRDPRAIQVAGQLLGKLQTSMERIGAVRKVIVNTVVLLTSKLTTEGNICVTAIQDAAALLATVVQKNIPLDGLELLSSKLYAPMSNVLLYLHDRTKGSPPTIATVRFVVDTLLLCEGPYPELGHICETLQGRAFLSRLALHVQTGQTFEGALIEATICELSIYPSSTHDAVMQSIVSRVDIPADRLLYGVIRCSRVVRALQANHWTTPLESLFCQQFCIAQNHAAGEWQQPYMTRVSEDLQTASRKVSDDYFSLPLSYYEERQGLEVGVGGAGCAFEVPAIEPARTSRYAQGLRRIPESEEDESEEESDEESLHGQPSRGKQAVVLARSSGLQVAKVPLGTVERANYSLAVMKEMPIVKSGQHLSASERAVSAHAIGAWKVHGEYALSSYENSYEVFEEGYRLSKATKSNLMELNNDCSTEPSLLAAQCAGMTFFVTSSNAIVSVTNNNALNRSSYHDPNSTPLAVGIPPGIMVERLVSARKLDLGSQGFVSDMDMDAANIDAGWYITGTHYKNAFSTHDLRVLPLFIPNDTTATVIFIALFVDKFRSNDSDVYIVKHAHATTMPTTELSSVSQTKLDTAVTFFRLMQNFVASVHDQLRIRTDDVLGGTRGVSQTFEEYAAAAAAESKLTGRKWVPPPKKVPVPKEAPTGKEGPAAKKPPIAKKACTPTAKKSCSPTGEAMDTSSPTEEVLPSKGKGKGKAQPASVRKGKSAQQEVVAESEVPTKTTRPKSTPPHKDWGNFTALQSVDVFASIADANREEKHVLLPTLFHHTSKSDTSLPAVIAAAITAGAFGKTITQILTMHKFKGGVPCTIKTEAAMYNGSGVLWHLTQVMHAHGMLGPKEAEMVDLLHTDACEEPLTEWDVAHAALHHTVVSGVARVALPKTDELPPQPRLAFTGMTVPARNKAQCTPAFIPAHGGDLLLLLWRNKSAILNGHFTALMVAGAHRGIVTAPASGATARQSFRDRLMGGRGAEAVRKADERVMQQRTEIEGIKLQLATANASIERASEVQEELRAQLRRTVANRQAEEASSGEASVAAHIPEACLTVAVRIMDAVKNGMKANTEDATGQFFTLQINTFESLCDEAYRTNNADPLLAFIDEFPQALASIPKPT